MGKSGLIKSFALLTVSVTLFAGLSLGADARADERLKSVKIGVGGSNILNLTYYYLLLPGPLGYWKEEGYAASVFPVSGSVEVAQQLAVNNLDFGEMNATAIIQANTEHNVPVRALITNSQVDWGLAVAQDGPVANVIDLKGKSIGLVSLSSGGVPLLKAFLRKGGLDPEADVTLVPTGTGVPAVTALQANRVQGLMYWGAALASFENAGLKLRVLRDPKWSEYPDFTFAANKLTIEKDPAMVEGIGRGIAKAMAFAATNPDCARQLQWKYYPDTKPRGIDESSAIESDMRLINVAINDQKVFEKINGDRYVAATSVRGFEQYQDFLYDSGIITKKIAPQTFVAENADNLWARINNFDRAAIEKQARECKF
jgi:NitT/TauT family transport system substrate-binding protein